jgi:hypothetical protein
VAWVAATTTSAFRDSAIAKQGRTDFRFWALNRRGVGDLDVYTQEESVAKVILPKVSKILRAAGAVFV